MEQINQTELPQDNISFQSFLETTKELTMILRQENQLIEERKISSIPEIQEKKQSLTAKLEKTKLYIARNREIFLSQPASEIEKMKDIANDFERALEENYYSLTKATEVNKRVLEAVVYAVSDNHTRGYNKSGYFDQTKTAFGTNLAMTPIVLNETA